MTCLRCQTIEAAIASGSELSLIDELYRLIDRLHHGEPIWSVAQEAIARDHERTVAALNATIAAGNTEIEKLRKQAP